VTDPDAVFRSSLFAASLFEPPAVIIQSSRAPAPSA
jgi:hypothetical protein